MAVLIFKLNDASEEEAEAVRLLLEEHQVDYYESSAGRWGVSIAGLWLRDESQKGQVRALIDAYQAQRVEAIRKEQSEHPLPSLAQRIKSAPLPSIAMLLFIAMVLYLSIVPFLGWL